MDSLGIEGAWVCTPRIHHDDRGCFLESFHGDDLAADIGYRLDVAQVNCSASRPGVIRGVHFADVPPGQANYVSCVRGRSWTLWSISGSARPGSGVGRRSGSTITTGGRSSSRKDSGTPSWR